MKKYIGTKTIMAKPMAKSEAEKVLNRSLADAKGGEDGYLVEYQDGYKSWSPKETFEEAYKVADTYLDRMRIEYADVKERVLKLHTFLMSESSETCPRRKRTSCKPSVAQCPPMSKFSVSVSTRLRWNRNNRRLHKLLPLHRRCVKTEYVDGERIKAARKWRFQRGQVSEWKQKVNATSVSISVDITETVSGATGHLVMIIAILNM